MADGELFHQDMANGIGNAPAYLFQRDIENENFRRNYIQTRMLMQKFAVKHTLKCLHFFETGIDQMQTLKLYRSR